MNLTSAHSLPNASKIMVTILIATIGFGVIAWFTFAKKNLAERRVMTGLVAIIGLLTCLNLSCISLATLPHTTLSSIRTNCSTIDREPKFIHDAPADGDPYCVTKVWSYEKPSGTRRLFTLPSYYPRTTYEMHIPKGK